MADFSGQKVIVTGATRGIGRQICKSFLTLGATVIGLYGNSSDKAGKIMDEARDQGHSLDLYQCDVADHDAVQGFYRELEKRHETLDVLVNNAGIRRDALTALMKSSDWQDVLDINLTGTFNMSKHVIPFMLKQKYGRIVNIVSPVAYLGFQGQANYAASKAGQIGLTRTLAKEVARKKITVNCVSPGFIATDFIEDLSTEQLSAYKKMVPMRRFGTTIEVADAVLFLASRKAAYITGSVLEITGGL